MWILRTSGSGTDEQIFRILPGNARTIGRSTGAEFIIDAPLVSRVHCRVTALPSGDLEVKDLDSTNGTFLNGTRITQATVAAGDRIQVGGVELIASRETA